MLDTPPPSASLRNRRCPPIARSPVAHYGTPRAGAHRSRCDPHADPARTCSPGQTGKPIVEVRASKIRRELQLLYTDRGTGDYIAARL